MEPPSSLLPPPLQAGLHAALATAASHLRVAMTVDGHWRGELSSSALSTATAVTALAVVARHAPAHANTSSISQGLAWLAAHPNRDGGWGDTLQSVSNISTTTLCWAAFGAVPDAAERHKAGIDHAEKWIQRHIDLNPKSEIRSSESGAASTIEISALVQALMERYGKDRTFSVPILTLSALAGRLGKGPEAWRWVRPLPFELAALPHQWFAAARLPVVSYALPALIAIGQARHVNLPSRNPLARWLRNWTRHPTLRTLERIQPSSGGFLEATPLTSFVVMSLAGSGQVDHPVTKKGLEFLLRAQRPDGSWAIDSDLATWVTTLSVNALPAGALEPAAAGKIGRWLLRQQFRVEHPYTHAAPGGWAWTDLPGGVPDADDTAGALRALVRLQQLDPTLKSETLPALRLGAQWLVDLQNRDGGIPTFCRGWGTLPFDRSSPDLTAHAIRAWLDVFPFLTREAQIRVDRSLPRAMGFLQATQRTDGSWPALWFGNQFAPGEENLVYGTSRVLCALKQAVGRAGCESAGRLANPGVDWLLNARNPDGGWGGAVGGPSSIEETALALEALAWNPSTDRIAVTEVVRNAVEWLIARVESGEWKNPAPIGLYFARLWYYEKLYPQIFTLGALASLERRGT